MELGHSHLKLFFFYLFSTNNEKINCASVLLRVRRAPRSPDGSKVLSIKDAANDMEAKVLGLMEDPPKYSDGKYNTSYCRVSHTELIIFDEKRRRKDPLVQDLVRILIEKQKGSGVAMDL